MKKVKEVTLNFTDFNAQTRWLHYTMCTCSHGLYRPPDLIWQVMNKNPGNETNKQSGAKGKPDAWSQACACVFINITVCCLSEASITTIVETLTMRGCPGVTPLTLKLAGSTAKCRDVGMQSDKVKQWSTMIMSTLAGLDSVWRKSKFAKQGKESRHSNDY